jgi:(p)ppGpp synthase/HD superfamily hydrolase
MVRRASEAEMAYSEQIDAALRLAAAAHYEDMRKGTQIPYVMHPFHVGLILDRHGFGEDLVIAGILHDSLEDPHYEEPLVQERLHAVCPDLPKGGVGRAGYAKAVEDYIASTFGSRVLDLVRHVTEQKRDEAGRNRDWLIRRREQLAALEGASVEHCALKAADSLHNLRAMSRDLRTGGAKVMERFNAGPEDTLWYYRKVVEQVSPPLGSSSALARELADAFEDFKAALREAGINAGS